MNELVKPAYTRSEQLKRREAIQKILAERARKRKRRIYIISGVLVFLVFLVYWGFMRGKTTIEFALCRTFIELQQVYPPSLNVIEVDPFDEAMRFHYTIRNSHGATRSQMAECIFARDPQRGLILESVNIDRLPYTDQEEIERFNKSIPSIIATDPDLTLPPPFKDNLISLKRDDKY